MNPILLALLKNVGTKILLEVADIAINELKGTPDNRIGEEEHNRVRDALAEYKARNGED